MELNTNRLLELANEFGDGFYLLDSAQFEKNYIDLSNAFKKYYPKFNIAYSYKTNYTPKLVKIVDKHGGYAEVVSDLEMDIALHSGVKYPKIIWNGPIKNILRVEELLLGGGTINVDSLPEMNDILKIANEHPKKQINVGLRCNYDVGDGVISRFGFDVESKDFLQAIDIIKKTANIKLINLQCHFAKRNVDFWRARTLGMLNTVIKVSKLVGYFPKRVDLGGGIFGNMPESLTNQLGVVSPGYEAYAKESARLFGQVFANIKEEDKPELLVEPGSALAGDSMKFVSRVKTIKTVRGKTFISLMGSQKNISMNNINPPMEIYLYSYKQENVENADFVGYTCIESDVLYKNYTGSIGIGDFVVFSNCGSYSLVMKPPFIMANFPVLDICDGETEVIKRQEKFEDLFLTYNF